MAKPPVKAEHFADLIAGRIRSGEIKPGEWLASERQLAEQHQVGRNTVRSALRMLAEAGVIEQTGSGARVSAAAAPRQPTAAAPVPDAAAVHGELVAIRAELREITERLTAIEARTGAANRSGS
jgi:GntR family transcriptional repressor for pyruvate dehydrogenase complex